MVFIPIIFRIFEPNFNLGLSFLLSSSKFLKIETPFAFAAIKKIEIKNYLKDHRVFMTSAIAALSFGGEWHIHDKDSIKTSFPSFLEIIKMFTK